MRTKVEIDSQLAANQKLALQALMVKDGEMGKRLRELIFLELRRVRFAIAEGIGTKFENGDPRGTSHSIKRYIAGKYLGGVVSIASYKVRATGGSNGYEAPRKLVPGQRGGNRMKRSARTQTMLSYGPQDRAFILNWVNAGTAPRYAGHGRNGRNEKQHMAYMEKFGGSGHRGQIEPRNFFETLGTPQMEKALSNLNKMIDEEFDKVFRNNQN